jgi:hypothetical protein
MKNKKNKIKEGALSQGITSYDTSNTTTTGSSGKHPTVVVPQNKLKDTAAKLKGTDAQIMVQKEEKEIKTDLKSVLKPSNFTYLSEVKDAKTNKISQPFTINGKQYQICRAITPERKKVTAVYSLDERDENGKNIIYDLKEFEENVAKKAIEESEKEEKSKKEETKEKNKEEKEENKDKEDINKAEFFKGCKHFIVNLNSGKIKKFKSIEELAKAKMDGNEKYMGIKEFKKYLDESLFGKRNIKEAPAAPAPAATTQTSEPSAVTHMMGLIDRALPSNTFDNIKQNPNAQKFAIIDFIKKVGVPADKLNDIINTVRGLAKQPTSKPATPTNTAPATTPAPAAPVTENVRIIKKIKKKDIK